MPAPASSTSATTAPFRINEFLFTKRQGKPHSPGHIRQFIEALMADEIPDYQVSAWLMAVCCQGLSEAETVELTAAMIDSGQRLHFDEALKPIVDKHSTGGVGDKTTLVLMPMLAACGLHIAKLSGRGLGFTGGTADKLEAIPGFNVNLDLDTLKSLVAQSGLALGTQTAELAPADARLYALRDVTATVNSIELITASIVSKKIAAGADVIVLDIKCGSGAFMETEADARRLAASCQSVGNALGRSMSCLVSSMAQPLGQSVGHTLEIIEAIETLKNNGPQDLKTLCVALGAEALHQARPQTSHEAARAQMQAVLENGQALDAFAAMVTAQGGNPAIMDNYNLMPHPKQTIDITARQSGTISRCDARGIAQAAKYLGAGRQHKTDTLDLAVGVVCHRKIADHVQAGETLATLWANDKGIEEARQAVEAAYTLDESNQPLAEPTLLL